MTRDEAYSLITSWTGSKNLIKHMLAVEAAMEGLYEKLETGGNNEKLLWRLAGLLHDADYEKYPDKHPMFLINELRKKGENEKVIQAIQTHAYGYNNFDLEPQSKMEWSLYCCDELTGFIVAVTLIRPEKKLSQVTLKMFFPNGGRKILPKVSTENRLKCVKKNWE